MIVIYPSDPTTNFLNSIIFDDAIKQNIKEQYTVFHEDNFEDSLDMVAKHDSVNTILFLGHGTSDDLKMSNNVSFTSEYATSIFNSKKLILVSCYSADFLEALNGKFEVGIGFGNIIESRVELSPADYIKYNHEDFRCIDLFRLNFVKILKLTLAECYSSNFTFLQLYYSLKLRINKIVSQCSLSNDKTMRLTGLLMYDLKTSMVLKGNCKVPF